MKSLKEPIARRANHDDKCTGALWGGRFGSVVILDESSLLATCAYIDLNPVAAGIAPAPEKSPHTSIKSQVDQYESQGTLDTLCCGSPYASKVNVKQGHWLLPTEGRRDQSGKGLPGVLHNISLLGYLLLIH